MENEIEKLKQDLAAALEAATRLAEIADTACLGKEAYELIQKIRGLRPKPKPLEYWLELNQCGGFEGHWSSEPHKDNLKRGHHAVHMREVTPAPKWERWEQYTPESKSIKVKGPALWAASSTQARLLCGAHNAEMERLAALWEGGAE